MTLDFSACFGCSACAAVCKSGAITMKQDAEGFFYPQLDKTQCIGCGACQDVCPAPPHTEAPKTGTAFLHPDGGILSESASGGAFSAVTEEFFARHPDGVVFGAAFDRNLSVHHIGLTKEEGIAPLHGSKYVQSEIGDVFGQILSLLSEKKPVLFSGTPCQAAALRKLAGYDENLLLVDIVCNGAASPGAWQKHLASLAGAAKSPVSSFRFRNKKYYMGRGIRCTFENGTVLEKTHGEDLFCFLYMRSFLSRPVCYGCPYTTPARDSDLTIGDFHGLEKTDPGFSENGASLVLAHTETGREYLAALEKAGKAKTYPIEDCLQPRLSSPAQKPMLRKLLLADLIRLPDPAFRQKYGKMLNLSDGEAPHERS